MQSLGDDWRIQVGIKYTCSERERRVLGSCHCLTESLAEQVAAPAFMLVDFLLSRQRIARYLFDSFRQPANLKKVLQARRRACLMRCPGSPNPAWPHAVLKVRKRRTYGS